MLVEIPPDNPQICRHISEYWDCKRENPVVDARQVAVWPRVTDIVNRSVL
jgi:hypothetical protein